MNAAIQNAAMLAQSAPITAPHATSNVAQAKKLAQQFEGVFISQMMGQMFEGISTDGPFGGGQGEEMFRSLLTDEYGKDIAAQGGLGLAPAITSELLKAQEVHA